MGLPLISAMAPLLVLPVLVRYVGTEAWAGIAIGQAIGTGASTLVMIGWPVVGPAVLAGDKSRGRSLYTESLISRLTVFCLMSPAAVALTVTLAPTEAWLEAGLMALAQSMLGLAPTWFFVGTGQPASIARFDTIPRVAATALAALLIVFFPWAWIYPTALLVVPAVLLVIVSVPLWERGRLAPLRTTVRVLRGQWAAALASAQFAVNSALPIALVAAVAPAIIVPFAALDRLMRYVLFFVQPVGLAFQGWVAEPSPSPGQRRRTAFIITTGAGLLLAGVFWLSFDVLMAVLFAGKVAVPPVAVALAALGLVAAAANITLRYHYLVPFGMSGWMAVGIAVNTVLAGVLLVLLAPEYGVIGATIAVVASGIAASVVQALVLLRRRRRKRAKHARRSSPDRPACSVTPR